MSGKSHPKTELMQQLVQAALEETRQRRQLLGWWLPLALVLGWVLLGAALALPWPFWQSVSVWR